MAQKTRRNQQYKPSRQIHKSYRPSQLVNELPKAEEETSERKTDTSQNIRDNEWSRVDRIAVWGVVVNAILALFTFLLFMLTRDSTISATKSANAAVTADSIARIELDSQKSAKKQSDAAEAVKQKRADDLFNLQKTSVGKQIESLKETQRQFTLGNDPVLQFNQDTTRMRIKADRKIVFFYQITPLGSIPIKMNRFGFRAVVSNKGDSAKIIKAALMRPNLKMEETTEYLSKVPTNPKYIDIPDPNNAIRTEFLKGNYVLFFFGRVEYINYLNNKKRYYDYVAELKSAKGNLEFSFIKNINYDIK
jgi:hypothetical protein